MPSLLAQDEGLQGPPPKIQKFFISFLWGPLHTCAGLLFFLAQGEGLQVLQGQNGTYGSLHSRCICSVLILPYICLHTTIYFPFRILAHECPQGEGLQGLQGQNGKYASLNIRCMCPHTTTCVSSCYCMYICVLRARDCTGKMASMRPCIFVWPMVAPSIKAGMK